MSTKEEKAAKKAAAKKERKNVWAEFKAFINRGNAFDLAVGVVIGGAFNAIVNALVNILLSLVTWAVPGGLKGLVTVLPAVNAAQAGMDPSVGLDQSFAVSELQNLAKAEATKVYADQIAADAKYLDKNPTLIEAMKTTILSKYNLHGTVYTYSMSAVIDWGTFINACISFIIIAATLFIIVKTVQSLNARKAEFDAKLKEEYYEKHPEERPVPPEPGKPEPTTNDLLKQILVELKKDGKAPAGGDAAQ